jgi:hypothetical protein
MMQIPYLMKVSSKAFLISPRKLYIECVIDACDDAVAHAFPSACNIYG